MFISACRDNEVLLRVLFCLMMIFLQTRSAGGLLQSHLTSQTLRISRSSTITALQMAQVDKGLNLLEIASKVVPQGRIVQTAKESWKFAWKVRRLIHSFIRRFCGCWISIVDTIWTVSQGLNYPFFSFLFLFQISEWWPNWRHKTRLEATNDPSIAFPERLEVSNFQSKQGDTMYMWEIHARGVIGCD